MVSAESKIILTLQGIVKGFKVRFGLEDEKAQPMIKAAEDAIKRSPAYSGYFSDKFPVISKHLRCAQQLKCISGRERLLVPPMESMMKMYNKWFNEVGYCSGINLDAGSFRKELSRTLSGHVNDGYQESDARQVCNIKDYLERYFGIQCRPSNIKYERYRQDFKDSLESVMQYLYGRKATNEKFYGNFLDNSIDADTISSRFNIVELSSSVDTRELLIARDKEMQVLLGVCELYTVTIGNSFADELRTRCSRRVDLMGFLFLDLDKWPASYEVSDSNSNKPFMTFRVFEERMQVEDKIRYVAMPKGIHEMIEEYLTDSVFLEIWRSHKDPKGDGFFWKWLSQHEYMSRFRKMSPVYLV